MTVVSHRTGAPMAAEENTKAQRFKAYWKKCSNIDICFKQFDSKHQENQAYMKPFVIS